MLAMLPSSVSHHDNRHVPVLSTSTLAFSRTSSSAGPGQMRTSRPTLTLNTAINSSKARSFGKGSSLSIHTLSAVSPTTKNTFANTYQSTSVSTPVVAQKAIPGTPTIQNRDVPTLSENTTTPTTSSRLTTTVISAEPQSSQHHAVSAGVSSILITSLTHRSGKAMSSKSRPSWSTKRVSFRDPLDEEIKTLKYVLAHSDIESDVSRSEHYCSDTPYPRSKEEPSSSQPPKSEHAHSSFSTKFSGPNTDDPDQNHPSNSTTSIPTRSSRRNSSPRPSQHLKRDSSSDEDSDDAVPKTPIAGRCKRRREWTWTLDPLPDQKTPAAAAATEGSVGSNDDDSMSTSSRFSESSTSQHGDFVPLKERGEKYHHVSL